MGNTRYTPSALDVMARQRVFPYTVTLMSAHPASTAAIVFPARGEVELREVPLPPLGPADVLVEVEHTTISAGTELHCLHGTIRLGAGPIRFPFTPGYQAAGCVRAAGAAVTGIAVGDRVFSARCKQPPGWAGGWWAGHCAWHVAAAADVIALPAAVGTRSASALLLAQVGYNGGARPPVAAGDAALVIGDGLVGQWAAQVLRHRGARVLLAGHRRRRLEIAAAHSADEVVDTHAADLGEWVRSHVPSGLRIAAETTGKTGLIRQAADLLGRHGHLVVLGYYPPGACQVDIHWLRARETTTHFPNGQERQRMERTLSLIEQGVIEVEELVTHRFAPGEAATAYRMLQHDADVLGVTIDWSR